MLTDLGGVLSDRVPVVLRWDMEAVLVRIGRVLPVSGLGQQNLEFLVPHVAEAPVEQQGEDVVFELPRIDVAAQDVRRLPEVPFKFRLRKRSH